jgi:hypothetical protein
VFVWYPQNLLNMDADHALADTDVRQRLSLNFIYELPFAKSLAGVSRVVLHGWQAGSIFTFQAGQPFTPIVNNVNFYANTGNRTELRANLIGASNWGKLPESQRTVDRFFDTAAFATPPQYTFGTAGRNILTADGISNVDLMLARNFQLNERHRIQFRAEFFNTFNHANFLPPNAEVDLATFGKLLTARSARQVQFGLKYNF